jgi:hypothetical protein
MDNMTHITSTRELPGCALRAYLVRNEAEAQAIAGTARAWLYQQTEQALYLFVELDERVNNVLEKQIRSM